MIRIAITPENSEVESTAILLAQKLHLPYLLNNNLQDFDYLLILTSDHLKLQQLGKSAPGAIFIDFLSGATAFRRKHISRERELLAKALGIKSHYRPSVIDATAGLGEDAFVMACLGCKVTLLERSPIIAALLQDALDRLIEDVSSRDLSMSLITTDAISFLNQLNDNNKPDVIYLDPMFPTRKKSALVKKEMRILREIVGDDLDSETLLEVAIKAAAKRVVVKRPRLAETLSERKPTFEIRGTNQRFDIYLTG